jgi:hypothetical protein
LIAKFSMVVWKFGRGGDAEVEEFTVTIFSMETEEGLRMEQVSVQTITSVCSSRPLSDGLDYLGAQ